MSITARVQTFFDTMVELGVCKNKDEMVAIWQEVHKGNPCTALITTEGKRKGEQCGRPCVKGESTCMPHLPKEKKDAIKVAAALDEEKVAKKARKSDEKKAKKARESDEKIAKEKKPRKTKAKEEKSVEEEPAVEEPVDAVEVAAVEEPVAAVEVKEKKPRKTKTKEEKPAAEPVEAVEAVEAAEPVKKQRKTKSDDDVPKIEKQIDIKEVVVCAGKMKSGEKAGQPCTKTAVNGGEFCAMHMKR